VQLDTTVQGKGTRRVASLKKLIAACAAASMLMASGMNTAALASTHDKTYATQILLNGKTAAKPYFLVHGSTKYVPISAVEQVLKTQGIHSTWNGHSWRLTTPSRIQPDLSSIHPGSGSTTVYVNGKLVLRVNAVVHTDPSSRKASTYIPQASVEQLLKRLQFDWSWSGNRWNLFSRDFELKVLSDAVENYNAATYRQMTATAKETVLFNLTDQGKQDFAGVDLRGTMNQEIDEKQGMVGNEQAVIDKVTTVEDNLGNITQQSISYYTQGSHTYENTGDGWQEISQQEREKELLTFPIDDRLWTNVHPKIVKNGFQYSVDLNSTVKTAFLDGFLEGLQAGNMEQLPSDERQLLLNSTRISESITVTTTGGKEYISSSVVHIQLTVPASLVYTGASPDDAQMLQDVDTLAVDLTCNSQYTYDHVDVERPADLP
jgi:hypothetical protein